MEPKSALDIGSEGNVAIARFKGNCICDVEEIANASASLRQYIEAHQPSALIFDFAEVKFFSSQVLGLLLEARTRLQPHEGRVVVSTLTPQLERVFRITNLDKLFTLHADLPAAMAAAIGGQGQSPASPAGNRFDR
jgi:anti-sigma B factor antagonist